MYNKGYMNMPQSTRCAKEALAELLDEQEVFHSREISMNSVRSGEVTK